MYSIAVNLWTDMETLGASFSAPGRRASTHAVSIANSVTILRHSLAREKLCRHGRDSLCVSLRASTTLALHLPSTGSCQLSLHLIVVLVPRVLFAFLCVLMGTVRRRLSLAPLVLPRHFGVKHPQEHHRKFWILQGIIDGGHEGERIVLGANSRGTDAA